MPADALARRVDALAEWLGLYIAALAIDHRRLAVIRHSTVWQAQNLRQECERLQRRQLAAALRANAARRSTDLPGDPPRRGMHQVMGELLNEGE